MSDILIPARKQFIAATPQTTVNAGEARWTATQKFFFRALFLFTIPFIIPFEPKFYQQFFASKTFFSYLSALANFRPNFIQLQTTSGRWGFGGYATWGVIALGAFAGAAIWTVIVRKKNRANYNLLYYWTSVTIRYRIAIGLIAFGFLKVYPMQMPYPALSNLITDFGDYNTYKIYWQHVGVSTWYEIVLGLVEVIGGVLMFFRATTAIGAIINAGVLFNIAHANFAYDGGVHVYSSFFVLFSLFLLVPYIHNLWRVFVQGKDILPVKYSPVLNTKTKKWLFYSAKTVVVLLFTVVYAAGRYQVHYKDGFLKDPVNPALPNATGYYNVTEFKLNNQVLPYNPLDSVRWQNVVFEKWGTLVYKVNKPFPISLANGTPNANNVERSYELAGIAGGRRFLYYEFDQKKQELYLQDKAGRGEEREGRNSAKQSGTKGKKGAAKAQPDKLTWHYERPTANRIILQGLTEKKDSIYVVLDRVDRPFPIQITRSN
ncbi:MAG: hypothetical protein J0I41_03330 [Filimonas sp.]|nr:hypothetical protein [Filimonas sp.]